MDMASFSLTVTVSIQKCRKLRTFSPPVILIVHHTVRLRERLIRRAIPVHILLLYCTPNLSVLPTHCGANGGRS